MTRLRSLLVRLAPILLLIGRSRCCVAGRASAGLGGAQAHRAARRRPRSQAPLAPAQPGTNPVELLAWLFTPIFQVLFITLVAFDQLDRQHR